MRKNEMLGELSVTVVGIFTDTSEHILSQLLTLPMCASRQMLLRLLKAQLALPAAALQNSARHGHLLLCAAAMRIMEVRAAYAEEDFEWEQLRRSVRLMPVQARCQCRWWAASTLYARIMSDGWVQPL